MKRIFMLANLILFLAVAAAFLALRRHNPASRWPDLEPFRPGVAAAQQSLGPLPAPPPVRVVALRKSEKDVLWQETLFDPDRRFEEKGTDPPPPPTPGPTQKVGDMELIGIGKIGERQAAIILVTARRGRGRNDEAGAKRNIYRVDDEVQDTGYKLVRIENDEVELKSNNRTEILALNIGDAASARRSQQAVREAQQERLKTQQQAVAQEDPPSATPPRPPPPPPAPGVVTGGNPSSGGERTESSAEERRERIRRALEARRRLLQKRREAQENNE